jgi:hypothetical protein
MTNYWDPCGPPEGGDNSSTAVGLVIAWSILYSMLWKWW